MISRYRKAGLNEPAFSPNDGLRIVLGRPLHANATLDTERVPLRSGEQILALSFDGISYHLKTLRAEGRIRHEGPAKAECWLVIPPIQAEKP